MRRRNEECRTRDISQYEEWCDTHNQDAHLCHFLPLRIPIINKSRRKQKVQVRIIDSLTDYGFMDRVEAGGGLEGYQLPYEEV